MRIFFHVACGRGSFPRGRLLCAPRYPRRQLYRRARGEGVSTRWSRSQSVADGGAWRVGARDGVPRHFDWLRTAASGGPGVSVANSRSMEHIWREEMSGSRGGPEDARDRAFAKPTMAWQLSQVCSLICQVVQNTNSKCKTVGYIIL
jgi:hypothetical protein